MISLENKEKKAPKRASLVEMLVFGLTFLIIMALFATTSDDMTPVNFAAATFVLIFFLTATAGKESIVKMTITIFSATVMGAAIAQKLSLLMIFAAIFGSLACVAFILIATKINAYKYKHMESGEQSPKKPNE